MDRRRRWFPIVSMTVLAVTAVALAAMFRSTLAGALTTEPSGDGDGDARARGGSEPQAPAAPSRDCRVEYRVAVDTISDASRRFRAEVAVTPFGGAFGPQDLRDWVVTFGFADSGQSVVQGRTGAWKQSGTMVTVTPAASGQTFAEGAPTALVFDGAWTASNPPPLSFSLNGVPCTGSTPDLLEVTGVVGPAVPGDCARFTPDAGDDATVAAPYLLTGGGGFAITAGAHLLIHGYLVPDAARVCSQGTVLRVVSAQPAPDATLVSPEPSTSPSVSPSPATSSAVAAPAPIRPPAGTGVRTTTPTRPGVPTAAPAIPPTTPAVPTAGPHATPQTTPPTAPPVTPSTPAQTTPPPAMTPATKTAPSVTMTVPSAGARLAATTPVTLTADASIPGGTVTKVEFYDVSERVPDPAIEHPSGSVPDTTLIAADAVAPYTVVVPVGVFTPGNHKLTARMYDEDGPVATSREVDVAVVAPRAGELQLTGVVRAGVEVGCLVLAPDAGAPASTDSYALLGGDATTVVPGARLLVYGQVTSSMTACAQGTPLLVSLAQALTP